MAPNPLPFRIQQQECSEWCWAAVVASVATFVNSDIQPKQCEVVDKEAFSPGNPSPGCCKQSNRSIPGEPNQICNRRANIGPVLADYNLTTELSGHIPSRSDFATIQEQIDAGSVVVIQVVDRANASAAHVMVITGYSGDDTVSVADPFQADSHFTFSYLALINPFSTPSGDSNWRLTTFFTTVPGSFGDSSDD